MHSPAPRPRLQLSLVAAPAALIAVTLVKPLFPREQWLQHAATAPALVLAAIAAQRRWLSDGALICALAFLALHAVAARWIYSYVPYEDWFQAALGSGPDEWFGWRRNHCDRFVHFAFGALAIPLLSEAAVHAGLARRAAPWVAVAGATTCGALYEIFEWLLAITAAPETADRYNGQQGDIWDAQKDLAWALAGSIVVALWIAWRRPRSDADRKPQES